MHSLMEVYGRLAALAAKTPLVCHPLRRAVRHQERLCDILDDVAGLLGGVPGGAPITPEDCQECFDLLKAKHQLVGEV